MVYAVVGAGGRVGRLVASALCDAGVRVRAIGRDAARLRSAFDSAVETAAADLEDPATLVGALAGAERLFIASPVHPRLAVHQSGLVSAAQAAGVQRIVKLSGSAWTMRAGAPTSTGAAHHGVEQALAAAGIEHACVRPNAFMQASLAEAAGAAASGRIELPIGAARVSYIDIADIAAVAAALLLAPHIERTVEITGPAAVSGEDLAASASALLGRPVAYVPIEIETVLERMRRNGAPAFLLRHIEEVLTLLRAGAAAATTGEVERLCGRPARSVHDFLRASLGR